MTLKQVIVVILAFLACCIVGYFMVARRIGDAISESAKSYLKARVESEVNRASNGKVSISVGDVSYNPIVGIGSIDSVQVDFADTTDTSVASIHFKVESVSISGLHPFKILFGDGVSIGTIEINKPAFVYKYELLSGGIPVPEARDTSMDTATFRIPRIPNIDSLVNEFLVNILPDDVSPLNIDNLSVNDAKGVYENKTSEKMLSGSYEGLSISISDIKVDRNSQRQHVLSNVSVDVGLLKRTTNVGTTLRTAGIHIDINTQDTSLVLDSFLYKVDTSNMYKSYGTEISFSQHKISMDSFRIETVPSDKEWYSNPLNSQDRFKAAGKGLVFADMDLRAMNTRNAFRVKKISFQQASLDILSSHRKKAGSKGNKPKPPPMIPQILNQLPFRVDVSEISINNMYILYGELHDNTNAIAELEWHNVKATVRGLSNVPEKQKQHDLHFEAAGEFMKGATMQASVDMPLHEKDYVFTATGSMTNLNALDLNRFLPVAEKLKIKSGHVQKATFDYHVKHGMARGKVDPLYTNLVFDILTPKERKSNFITGIMSFVANWLAIRNDNTRSDHKVGDVSYRMNKQDAIMQTIWFPVRSGIGDVVGF